MTLSSFFPITSNLYLALLDADQAERMAQHSLKVKYIILPMCRYAQKGNLAQSFTPCSLVELFKFNAMTNQIERQNADQKLVFASGCNVQAQRRAIFLIGSHMIMAHGLSAESSCCIFNNFKELFASNENSHVSIMDCWCALDSVRSLRWIDFQERFDIESSEFETIDMDEFIHYSRYICRNTLQHTRSTLACT